MFGVGPLLVIVVLAMIFGGFYYWAQRQGLLTTAPAEGEQSTRRISLLTEAVAYIGAILLLAGGGAAIGQRWNSMTGWAHVSIFAGTAALFLAVGITVRGVREPAIQRLVGVVWFLSVVGVACAAGFATHDVYGHRSAVTVLAAGVAATVYAAALWLIRRRALQNIALFAGLVTTICGTIVTAAGRGSAPSLAFAAALWAFGLVWAGLGLRRYVEPIWVTTPAGVILALIAPSFTVEGHGWVYAIAIATAAAAMAISVPLRNAPLLALGTLAMFGYVTSSVVRYFHESLGVPAALAITGALVLALAVATARLMRAARPSKPREPAADRKSHHDHPKAA